MKIEDGITQDAKGNYRVTAGAGSGKRERRERKRYPPTATLEEMRAWRVATTAKLEGAAPGAARGTLAADVIEYLRTAPISKETRTRREQQLGWWCAQPASVKGSVLSVEAVAEQAAARARGEAIPPYRALGEIPRAKLEVKRLREVLAVAFAPPDPRNPTEHASTSNSYRTALYHLFTVLDQDAAAAINPLDKVAVRPQQGARASGQDARVVREILRHCAAPAVSANAGPVKRGHPAAGKRVGGKPGDLGQLRLAVLAWVHITPTQLMDLDPRRHFHDVPDATREDILAGAITITKHARLKGRLKRIPPPETIPLNYLGVAAMRAFAAEPRAWGSFSCSSLNKSIQRGAALAQAALTTRGVAIDLADWTLYHLKHSLATTASLASAGLVDRQGKVRQSPGVSRALDHARLRTTSIYTQAAVDPIVRRVNELTGEYLEELLGRPLPSIAAQRIKLVGRRRS